MDNLNWTMDHYLLTTLTQSPPWGQFTPTTRCKDVVEHVRGGGGEVEGTKGEVTLFIWDPHPFPFVKVFRDIPVEGDRG